MKVTNPFKAVLSLTSIMARATAELDQLIQQEEAVVEKSRAKSISIATNYSVEEDKAFKKMEVIKKDIEGKEVAASAQLGLQTKLRIQSTTTINATEKAKANVEALFTS